VRAICSSGLVICQRFFVADRDGFKPGAASGFSFDNLDGYPVGNAPGNPRNHREHVPEQMTSPRRVPAPSVRNGFNPPDLGSIVQKERQQLEYADMLKQQMREREESKAAAKHAKRIEEEAELDRAPQQPAKSFAKQKVSSRFIRVSGCPIISAENVEVCGAKMYFGRLWLKRPVCSQRRSGLSCWKNSVCKWRRKSG
jgi:hypothetical protein